MGTRITDIEIFEGQPLEACAALAIGEFCARLHVEPSGVIALVEAGVIEPAGAAPESWVFPASELLRARVAARLIRDLGVNAEGVAIILDLVEQRRALEQRLRLLEQLLDELAG